MIFIGVSRPSPIYEERGWLIGDGRIGGKSKGLSFAHHILEKNGLLEDVHLPKYSVITTSVFDEFMEYNNLWERLMNLRALTRTRQAPTKYEAASLPPSLDEPIEDTGPDRGPISVRSSSTLEDDVNLSFARRNATRFSSMPVRAKNAAPNS